MEENVPVQITGDISYLQWMKWVLNPANLTLMSVFSAMKDDGTDYYQYVLLYTEDILSIMQNPEDFIRHELGKRFVVKPKSIGPPTRYIGNKVSYVTLENGQSEWSFRLSQYVQDAVKEVIDTLS